MGEAISLSRGNRVSKHDSGDHRDDSESLLDRCAHGNGSGSCRISLQLHVLGALACGRFAVVVFETGEVDSEYKRGVSTVRGKQVVNKLP